MGYNDSLAGLASVQKAFALLDVVAAHRRGLAAKEIASELAMPLPTVYRLLKTLTLSGHVVHLREEGLYALGYKLHALDTSLRRQVGTPPAVARLIRELHQRADAAAYYAVHRGEDIVVAHVVESPNRPRITPMGFGFNDAAHATAFGKVLLAAMEAERRQGYLQKHGMPSMTSATICDPERFATELAAVRAEGLAIEREEFIRGASCLAAPVTTPAGQVVGSVAVSMDPAEFQQRHLEVALLLRDVASRVSRALRGTSLLDAGGAG
ncbi:IclR family transcriptional regulator [Glutamicibacter sp. JL.03c]|uniref:IclR family transcriptional regulator n=1 Tax=Glutamicibacter sp. JL.03c TaxID=2984842 RepID=UPI0021F6D37E|nr:IclR family transcriptional regulator [Glutamicibacter sp. JL.03c]UYQ77310.1 IclR family transcriptional regulator [Glutamicibacter sp. JL.03c]